MRMRSLIGAVVLSATTALTISTASSQDQAAAKPNILVIFGDDIGQTNLSTYSFGLMGYSPTRA